ncbi:hypothetical protein [Asticcacaulis endophyticus]|uniref:Uncharacterized protein n=1 Tax=Asticcacaulis endophyticus TaxID=1395890 RepID=A0A918QD34_9CAUL|nr:hypothetical protein [Asticcacaulis endophyticus]GGZ39225.1 hypothetical protein GCM10011273_27060 [Asticcacaulis endophyticus]
MKKADMARAGAAELFVFEHAIEDALSKGGDLIGTLSRLRIDGNLSITIGQDAINEVVNAIQAVAKARQAIVAAHAHLDTVKTQIGCRTVAVGTYDKPEDDKRGGGTGSGFVPASAAA